MTTNNGPRGEPIAAFSDSDSDIGVVCPGCGGFIGPHLVAELVRLQEENRRLTDELAEALAVSRRFRDRLSLALSGQSSATRGNATLDSSTHAVLADRYQDLIAQDVHHLLREHLGVVVIRNTPARLAQEISSLCRDLFVEGHQDAHRMCRRMGMDEKRFLEPMKDLVAKAGELRDQARDVEWVLDIVPDSQLDPQLQQVWGQCDPLTEVQFTVVPGYHVNGRVYAKQQVFTKRRRSWLAL